MLVPTFHQARGERARRSTSSRRRHSRHRRGRRPHREAVHERATLTILFDPAGDTPTTRTSINTRIDCTTDKVVRGEVIGYVGTTGNAPPNTPHLRCGVQARSRAGGSTD
jgi:hypothetical protein